MDQSRRVRTLTLFATALGSALAFLDTTIVIVALPRMEEDLGLGLTGQQWVYLAYALSLSAFYLVGGAIGTALAAMFLRGSLQSRTPSSRSSISFRSSPPP